MYSALPVPLPALESHELFDMDALHARGKCVHDRVEGHIQTLRGKLHACGWNGALVDRYVGFGYHVQDLGCDRPNRRARVLAWIGRRIGARPCQSGHTHRLTVYTYPKTAAGSLRYVAGESALSN